MDDASTYSFGFIYIDAQAGLPLNNEGTFKYVDDNSFEVNKLELNIKTRLEPNNVTFSLIPI